MKSVELEKLTEIWEMLTTALVNTKKTIDCHRKHLEIAEELGDRCGVGKAYERWGNA